MLLHQLCTAPHVTISYDAHNDWLYIEWEGYLTLAAVQYACVEVAHCYLEHAYPRVLNSNALVTGIDHEVESWLATNFLPNLGVAGVEQLAWVQSPTLRSRTIAQHAAERAPQQVYLALFNDVEEAVGWLQQAHFSPTREARDGSPLPPAGGKLARVVEGFTQHLKEHLAEHSHPKRQPPAG